MEKLRQGDPDSIGPYNVIARLGAGGMGVVFLGTLGADRVAIKVVRSTFLDDPSLRARFEREIETLRRISSRFVAKILDASIEGELAWHAVEFVNGPTLKELVDSRGPLDEAAWFHLADGLREALGAIHSLGITHRDIKPSNIIMSETGPKIIDFGISQDSEATSLTSTGMVAGSPAWLSPEQLDGTEITSASDLYSAGSVLTFAATGFSPWGQETSMSVPVVYQKILSNDISLDGLSARQRTLVSKLLTANPASRRFDAVPAQNAMRDAPAPAAPATSSADPIRNSRDPRADENPRAKMSTPKPQRKWVAAAVVPSSLLVFGLLAFLVVAEPSDAPPQEGLSVGEPRGGPPGECSTAYSEMQAVRLLVNEGGTSDDVRAIEEGLSQALGGANIFVSEDSPNNAKRSVFVVRTALRTSLSEGATAAEEIMAIFARQDAIARGINAFDKSCTSGVASGPEQAASSAGGAQGGYSSECLTGEPAMERVRLLLDEGGSFEELRGIEQELSQVLGGSNIVVSTDSPNGPKRALYVVRTSVRASLSEGATGADDIQAIFANQNAVALGINAFDAACG